MRKLIFTTACLVLFSLALAEAQIYVGPKIGGSLNRFSLRGDDVADFYSAKIRPGFTAGITADIPLFSGLSVQTEVLYSQSTYYLENPKVYNFFLGFEDVMILDQNGKPTGIIREDVAVGSQYDAPIDIIQSNSYELYWDESYQINSLDIPLLLKYEFIGSSFGYFIEAGPVISVGLNGELDGIITNSLGSETDDDWLSNIVDQRPEVTRNYERWIEDHSNRDFISNNDAEWLLQNGFTLTSGDFDGELLFQNNVSSPFGTINLGIALGAGIYIETGLGRAYLGLRYIRGTGNFWNESYQVFQYRGPNQRRLDYEAFDTRTNNLQLSVSYAFPLGGGF
ncbi:MAG: PorT family protein [bacterium]|nr:PorT family protein [bacterium]